MRMTMKDGLLIAVATVLCACFAILARRVLGGSAWVVAIAMAVALVLVVQLAVYRQLLDALVRFQREPTVNYRQIESLFSLFAALKIDHPLPPMRAAAVSPDFANTLICLIREARPRIVLELGSGLSTIITAYCLRQSGQGRIVSLEQDAHYALVSEKALAMRGLQGWATVAHAPLCPMTINGRSWLWYATAPIQTLPSIDLLIVDGPLQEKQPTRLIRYPALPALFARLSPDAVIVLDDCDRPDERRVVEFWLKEFSGLAAERVPSEKGTIILRRTGGPAPFGRDTP